MKKSIIIISFFTLSILSFFSCSKSKDASLTSFSGIEIRVDGTEYSLPQSQYKFLIQKVVNGQVVSYELTTQTPSSPAVNQIDFHITTATTLTPGVYTWRQSFFNFLIKINRTTSGGYHFFPRIYKTNNNQDSYDFTLTLRAKNNNLGTGDFSLTCWNIDQSGSGITSKEYSVEGDFYNIPILE